MSGETINKQSSRLMVDGALFPEGELDVVIDSRNSNKMAAIYTVHTSLIRILNCLSFPNLTLKTY